MTPVSTIHGHDFSDRLNPFLVKELRQGLRGRVYLVLFLVLITVLTLHALIVMDLEGISDLRFSDAVFKVVVGFTLMFLLPMNILGAIAEERRGKKIELVMLTRVRARGVVLGKWITCAIQSATLTAVIAPFIVLRYFAGGVNFVDDLFFLAIMLCGGFVAGALTLCASSFIREGMPVIGALIRAAVVIGGFIGSCMILGAMLNTFRGSGDNLAALLLALVTTAILVPLLIEIAASRLAPEAENHAGNIRLLALAGAIVGATATVLIGNGASGSFEIGISSAFLLLLVANTFTLFSTPVIGHEYKTPADRLGGPGRFLGKTFLLPGGASGFLFSLVTTLVCGLLAYTFADAGGNNTEAAFGFAVLWAVPLWPLGITMILGIGESRRFGWWLTLQAAALLLAAFIHSQSRIDRAAFDFIPTTGIFTLMGRTSASVPLLVGPGVTVILMIVGIIRDSGRTRRLENTAPSGEA